MSKKNKVKTAPSHEITSKRIHKKRPIPLKHLLAIGLLVIAAFIAYANTFRVPFLFDDTPNIEKNPNIQIKIFASDQLEQLVRNTYPDNIRIFASFTFALNYYFGRFNVFGYHLVNLLIHIASGIFLYWTLVLTFNLPSLKNRYGSIAFPIALFSSLLFIVHPVQTQSVTYIVQRMTSMAGMFYLLAMLLYVRGRLSKGTPRLLYWLGMALSYLLALFSKENAAILPFYVALYELYFFQNFDLSPKEKKIFFYLAGAVFLIGILIAIFWGKRYFLDTIEVYKTRDFTLVERVLTQFRVVLYYITLLLYPHPSRLNLDYDFSISRGILNPPETLFSILIIAGLLVYSIWTAKKRPLLSYCILWYFGNLVIESSIFPLEMVFEHRLYVPSIGPLVLFALLVVKGWEKVREITNRRQKAEGSLRNDLPFWIFILLIGFFFGLGSYQRNGVWKNGIVLWEDCVKKSPHKPRTHNNLGYYLIDAKFYEKGVEELNIALKLDPKYVKTRFNLGLAYGEMKLFDKAVYQFEEYIRSAPDDPEGYNEVGILNLQMKKIDEAIRFFKKGLELNPNLAKIYASLGNAYLQKGMVDEAILEFRKAMHYDLNLTLVHVKLAEAYEKKGLPGLAAEEIKKALQMDPSFADAHIVLGAKYIGQGRIDEAIAELTRGLKDNTNDPSAYNNLGVAYRRKQRLDEAIANFKRALSIDPSFSDARVNLGEVYFEKGMAEEGISELQHALRLDPEKAELHNNLAAIYLQKKRLNEAISHLKKAITIDPKYGDAYFNLAVAYYYGRDIPAASFYAKKALDLGYEVNPELLKKLQMR